MTTFPLVRRQLAQALRRGRRRPHAVVACSLDDVLGRWGADVLDVVYGTDDYVAGAALMNLATRGIEAEEARQLRRADAAVVVSPELADRWRGLGFAGPVTVVPNGVDAAAYADLDRVAPAPDVDLPGPVAGVVGQLSDRTDLDLLEAVVAAGCSLLLVGPHDPGWQPARFAALTGHPRVRWVGAKPFAELPPYLRAMDVGLTPYRDSAFNRASFPLKTLEYLAAGLPVVSTDLPAVHRLGTDLVSVAAPAEFGAAAHALGTRHDGPGVVAARRALAQEHSWQGRAEAFAAAIGLPDPGEVAAR